MDLRHLQTFRAVVERGSFSAAAEGLEISQPAVSAQIRSLEERFGQRLIDRGGRRGRTTEAGDVLFRYAGRILQAEVELRRAIVEVGEGVGGRLELGASTGPGELIVPGLLGAFSAKFPEVDVRLGVFDSQTVCERALEDQIELGFVGAARPLRGLSVEPFLRDELVVIVLPGHAFAARESVSLGDLVGEPLLMQQQGSGVRAVLGDAMRAEGLRDRDVTVAMELGLQQSVKAGVLDGFGITVISRLAVEREVADGTLVAVPLAGKGLARDFCVVRAARRTPSRAGEAFMEFARREVGAPTMP